MFYPLSNRTHNKVYEQVKKIAKVLSEISFSYLLLFGIVMVSILTITGLAGTSLSYSIGDGDINTIHISKVGGYTFFALLIIAITSYIIKIGKGLYDMSKKLKKKSETLEY